MVANRKVSPLLVIVGETASGKSALAMDLARRLDGEIICADSWTVRKQVNIGTAKPSAEDQKLVPHHLIDIVEPDADFTAAVFKRLANTVIKDITSRGKLPIMVGGTGLYIDSVLYDYGFLPAGDRLERQELSRLSVDKLLQRVQHLRINHDDIDIRNKRRLIRLIETKGAKPSHKALRHNTLIVGLKTPREVIEQRIVTRIDAMLAAGLEQEVQGLAERYGWDCEALKGVGYAQWRGYFSGTQSLPETRLKIIKATFELAKRQRTWFKRNKSIHWLITPVSLEEIVDSITTILEA